MDGTFPEVTALTSTGVRLFWGSGTSIWRFTPGDAGAERIYRSSAAGASVWDLAAEGDVVVFSERLVEPVGAWRVALVVGDGPPTELDAGVAERGAPPTVSIDARRLAWAGFDEASGDPRTFLAVAGRADPAGSRTLLDADIDDRLLWYPELDGETLWYSTIDADFEGTGEGDAFHIETFDLADPGSGPSRFRHLENVFEPVVTEQDVAWKQVDAGFSALTWGEIHVLDRRTNEELVIAGRANHPSVGSRFVAYEEFFHRQLLLYDLATHRTVEVPDALPRGNGTIGIPSISGSLLGFSTSSRGEKTVFWSRLPA